MAVRGSKGRRSVGAITTPGRTKTTKPRPRSGTRVTNRRRRVPRSGIGAITTPGRTKTTKKLGTTKRPPVFKTTNRGKTKIKTSSRKRNRSK